MLQWTLRRPASVLSPPLPTATILPLGAAAATVWHRLKWRCAWTTTYLSQHCAEGHAAQVPAEQHASTQLFERTATLSPNPDFKPPPARTTSNANRSQLQTSPRPGTPGTNRSIMCNKCMCLTSNSYFCVFAAKPKSLLQAENLQEKSACESDPKQLKTMCEFADTFRQPTAGPGRARLHPWSSFKSLD